MGRYGTQEPSHQKIYAFAVILVYLTSLDFNRHRSYGPGKVTHSQLSYNKTAQSHKKSM